MLLRAQADKSLRTKRLACGLALACFATTRALWAATPTLGVIALDKNLALYAWHGSHHIAHITTLRKRQGW